MKRVLAVMIAMALCFQLLGIGVSAASAGIGLSTVEGMPGEQVTVNVKIEGNTGLAYLKLKVAYDSNVLTLIRAENSGLLSGTYTTSKTTDVNPYVLQWMGAGNSVGDGTIATLTFEISETAAAGDQIVSLLFEECYDEEFDDVAFTLTAGTVTITKPVCNHVWDNGKITTPAGCETTGIRTYACTMAGCGETKTEIIPANGHSFGEWEVTKAPTATEKGIETRECACGEKETQEIEAVGDLLYGDVNGDGVVDSDDAALICYYDAELIDEDELNLSAGDVTGDGYVDSDDAALICYMDAEIIDYSDFPCFKK